MADADDSNSVSDRRWLLGSIGLVLLVVVTYLPISNAGFVWDDPSLLTENALVSSPDGWWRAWVSKDTADYYPLVTDSFWLEWRLGGVDRATHQLRPAVFHWTNVMLHAVGCVLLWRVLKRLGVPAAWVAAAVFALHPVAVASVAWVAERKNTLSFPLAVGAVWCFLKAQEGIFSPSSGTPGEGRGGGSPSASVDTRSIDHVANPHPNPPPEYRRRGTDIASVVLFAMAVLAKTSVVPLPVVLPGIVWWRLGRITPRDVVRVLPFFAITLAAAAGSVWYQYHNAIGADVVRPEGFASRIAAMGWCLWFYLGKLVAPVNLAMIYPRWAVDGRQVVSYLPDVALLAMAAVAWAWRKTWGGAVLMALAYFIVMLSPVLGMFNVYYMRFALVADHWQYLAMIGPIVLVVAWGWRWTRRLPVVRPPLVVAVLVTLMVLSSRQAGVYQSRLTLFGDNVAKYPNSWMAHNALGDSQRDAGDLDAATRSYHAAAALNDADSDIYLNLADVFQKQHRPEDALAAARKAVERANGDARPFYQVGNALADVGDSVAAGEAYGEAVAIDGQYAEAYANWGLVLARQKRWDEAIDKYKRALAINPTLSKVKADLARAEAQLEEMQTGMAAKPQTRMSVPPQKDKRRQTGMSAPPKTE